MRQSQDAFAARWRIGIAAACPSVINAAKPSMHQVEWMRVRGQRWEGADGAADLEEDVSSAEMVRDDGCSSTRSGRPCERG